MKQKLVNAVGHGVVLFVVVVFLPTAWVAVKAFIFDDCDSRFGCIGGIQFVLFISAIAGGFAGLAVGVSRCFTSWNYRYQYISTIVAGIILTVVFHFVPGLNKGIPYMLVVWTLVSVITTLIIWYLFGSVFKDVGGIR